MFSPLASPSRFKPTPPRYQFSPFIHHRFHVINLRQSYEKVVEVSGCCECQWAHNSWVHSGYVGFLLFYLV
jgi:hypothetical protein